MANISDLNYENIDTPYNNLLERSNENVIPTTALQGSSSGDETSSDSSGSSSNNSDKSSSNPESPVVEQVVGGQSFDNIVINTWIKSINYKPKSQGFMIDGAKGYIECMKLYVGNGGIIGGSLDIPDQATADSFHVDNAGNTWWGCNNADWTADHSNAKAYVLKTGYINAVFGTIGGCTLATTSIGSTTFVSGPLGSGWNISNTGRAELQDAFIRGVIRTSVFEKDTISCVNGMVLVSKADVLNTDMTALDASTVVIVGETTFVNNEVIRIKDGTDDEWMLVTDASGAPTYVVTRDLASSYPANTNPIWKKGTAVVSMGVGTGTKTGFILLDSSSSNSPYIDIYGRNSNTYTDYTIHGRFGWLKGITDADVGLATTDVWGLYTDNAYIKGVVVANTGYIGGTTGWVIAAGSISSVNTGNTTTMASGGTNAYIAGTTGSPQFIVTHAGALIASSATITGAVNATSGKFGTSTNYWSVGANGLTAISASTDVMINYGKTDFDNTQTGFILGYDFSDSKSKFYLGTTTNYWNFDGVDIVQVGGTFTSGSIYAGLHSTSTSGATAERMILGSSIGGGVHNLTKYDSANEAIIIIGGVGGTYQGYIKNKTAGWEVLDLVQTADANALVLSKTGAGTGNVIDITNSGTGYDIDGTGSTWYATKAGAIVGTSYGGILHANIVDKTDTETITGNWTFNNLIANGLLVSYTAGQAIAQRDCVYECGADVTGQTLRSYTGDNTESNGLYTGIWLGQGVDSSNMSILWSQWDSITIVLDKVGTPVGTITLEVQKIVAGNPDGIAVATSSKNAALVDGSTTFTLLSPLTFATNGDATYVIVLKSDCADTGNSHTWRGSNSSGVAEYKYSSNNGGASWTSSVNDRDFIVTGTTNKAGQVYRTYYGADERELNWIGFANGAIAKKATGNIQISGIVSGFTGLTNSSLYELFETGGAIQAKTTHRWDAIVGRALGTTKLLISHYLN